MTCVAGRLSKVSVSDDGGTTYQNVGLLVDATLSGEVDELECTSHDSSTREFVPNFFSATMDLSMRWCDTDLGQVIITESVFPTTSVIKVQFDLPQGSGYTRFEADAFVTSYSASGPLDDIAALEISVRLSDIVKTVQP